MSDFVERLTESELGGLSEALRAGRLRPPFTGVSLQQVVAGEHAAITASALQALLDAGAGPAAIPLMLDSIVADRRARLPPVEDAVDFVTSGPEAAGITNRDTTVVVRELFANAQSSVLVVGYAVHQGQRVFAALADRMQEKPELCVRLFLDIQRTVSDTSANSQIVYRFADWFVRTQWPVDRPLPTAYYYPPSLELEGTKRACLHAKCVVVDNQMAFISSANFTEAAQERNIEVGVLVRSQVLAARITAHFDALVAADLVTPLPLP